MLTRTRETSAFLVPLVNLPSHIFLNTNLALVYSKKDVPVARSRGRKSPSMCIHCVDRSKDRQVNGVSDHKIFSHAFQNVPPFYFEYIILPYS